MLISEHLFGVGMRRRLIISGEVQVDIRHLVSFKAQKRLKRDILAVSAHDRAAVRTCLVRKVKSVEHAAVRIEMRIFAFRADIVRRKRIDLGDVGHRRHEARSHRSAAADQIAVLQALLHQQMRDIIDHIVAGADDAVQLPFQSLFHDLRQRIAIFFSGVLITDIAQLLV